MMQETEELSTETAEEAPVETATPAATATATPADKTPADKTPAVADKTPAAGKTIVTGADSEAEDAAKDKAAAETKAANPDPWKLTDDVRKAIAEHYAAGDKKAYDREMKRLARIDDIHYVWGSYRELESKFTSGGLIKLPGKDAKPEDIAAFHKALGVPEKPEDYLKDVKLENGAVLGDADKPIAATFAEAMHEAGAPPAVVNKALNWYFKQQEEAAAQLDEADDNFRRESEKVLKEEFGPAFKRKANAIATLFATAPGGTDVSNPNSLMARLMGGRTADGRIIGNDPDMVRFLVSMAGEINPVATVVEEGNQSGMSIDQELANIDKFRRENRPAYNKDYKMQARERELLEAQQKHQARQRA